MLFNSPPFTCRLLIHDVLIRAPRNYPTQYFNLNTYLSESLVLALYLTLLPYGVSSAHLLPDIVWIPPPQDITGALNPLHPSTKFIYRTCCNVIRNGGLLPLYTLLCCPQTRRLYVLLCRGGGGVPNPPPRRTKPSCPLSS